jgi:hypothetical protein
LSITKTSQRGQTLVLFAFILIAVLALAAFVVDGGLYVAHWQELQVNLDAACISAALANARGINELAAFQGSLNTNGVDGVYYDPYEVGSDGLVTRGIQWHGSGNSFFAALKGPHDFYLAQFMKITSMNIAVRSRCTIPEARAVPIAVKELWLDGAPHPILGQESPGETQCDDCQGADFAGAVLPWVRCEGTNCDPKTFYEPTTESNSPNVHKDVFRDSMLGNVGIPLPTDAVRVPQVSGVSNQFLVKAMEDAGFEVGDQILVLVFDGVIDQPEPGYGNWENLLVKYFAIFEITAMDTNTVDAEFVKKVNFDEYLNEIRPRTIPWSWGW